MTITQGGAGGVGTSSSTALLVPVRWSCWSAITLLRIFPLLPVVSTGHDPIPDCTDQRRQRHRGAWLPRIRLLDGIDRECADRVDRQLFEIVASNAAAFSTWPPNSKRIAESSLSAKSASPRELNRSYSAADNTWAGTPSSIAASMVQRPSPESDTRPAKCARSGDCINAAAERSSSQDATTLPRRQSSAMSGRLRSYW